MNKTAAPPDLRAIYKPEAPADILWGYLLGYRGGSIYPIVWRYWHKPAYLRQTLRAWLDGMADRRYAERHNRELP